MKYQIRFNSGMDNLSPVFDLVRMKLLTITNRLDNPSASNTTGFLEETEALGGSASAKYVTKEIVLDNPSTALDVYLGINRPQGTDVEVYGLFNNTSNLSDPAYVTVSALFRC